MNRGQGRRDGSGQGQGKGMIAMSASANDDVEMEENPEAIMIVPLQPEWANAPTVDQLKQDVTEAESDFNIHVSNVQGWLNVRDAKLKVSIGKGRSKMSPKLVRKQNEWRYSALTEPLLASEDMYDVKPRTHKDVDSATDNALILNKQFEIDIDRVEFIDNYVRTAVDEGTVIVRVGWEFEEDEITYLEPIQEQILPPEVEAQLNQSAQAVQAGQMDPMEFQQQVMQSKQQLITVDTDQFEEVTEIKQVKNKPTLEICDFDKVMIDPTCKGDMDNAEFIVYQFQSSKAELREDGKYKNIDAIMFDENDDQIGTSDETVYETSFEFKDEPRRKITVTEYWGYWDIDKDGTTMPIVATYVGSVMIRLEENPFPDQKPPFVKAVYLPKRRDVYGGEPDAVLTEEQQDVVGAVTRGMIDLMGKSANAQQGVSANALDPAQKLRFEQGKDFIFNPDVDPSKAFWMATYPEIPQSALQTIEYQTHDAEGLSGSRPFAGASGTSSMGTTATETRSATDATAKRELGILRRLSTGIVDIGKKVMAMNAINLSDEEVLQTTDGEWVKIKRDSLSGEYDLRMSISTPEVDNEQAQDLGFMLQTIGPNMDPGLQSKILGKIARLKKMPGLANDIETYKPEPDPQEEEIKKLQIELLRAQVANEQAKGTENQADTANKYADTDLTKAKTATEKAKIRSLESGSDMTDLQFLQQKGGVDHAREMQKMDKAYDQELGKKGADSLLSSDTPFKGNNFPPSSGSAIPKYSTGNNLKGMDTPQENLDDLTQI